MARVTRIAVDVALVSLRTAKPAVSKVWLATKTAVGNTKAKPIVFNPIITKLESGMDSLSEVLMTKLREFRTYLLPKEEQYLIKELEMVRRKMKDGSATTRAIKPQIGTMWQYVKIEIVPPMTLSFFNGPVGKSLENTVGNLANTIESGLEKQIQKMKQAEATRIKDKEEALKAAEAKAKAAKIKQSEEDEKKKGAAKAAGLKAAAEIKAAADKAAKPKAAAPKSEEKKKDSKKAGGDKKTQAKKNSDAKAAKPKETSPKSPSKKE